MHVVAFTGGEHFGEDGNPICEGGGRGHFPGAAVGLGYAGDVDAQARSGCGVRGLCRRCVVVQDVEMEVWLGARVSLGRFAPDEGGETGLVAYIELEAEGARPGWWWCPIGPLVRGGPARDGDVRPGDLGGAVDVEVFQ